MELTVGCDHRRSPRKTLATVHKNDSVNSEGVFDEAACLWQVNQKIRVVYILDRNTLVGNARVMALSWDLVTAHR